MQAQNSSDPLEGTSSTRYQKELVGKRQTYDVERIDVISSRRFHRRDSAEPNVCLDVCVQPRLACIFFGCLQLGMNVLFFTVFVYCALHRILNVPPYQFEAMGSSLSFVNVISACFLIAGAKLRIRALFWPALVLTLVQFVPCACFVHFCVVRLGAGEWEAVTSSCIVSLIVLALSLYQLMVTVSYYMHLSEKYEETHPNVKRIH